MAWAGVADTAKNVSAMALAVVSYVAGRSAYAPAGGKPSAIAATRGDGARAGEGWTDVPHVGISPASSQGGIKLILPPALGLAARLFRAVRAGWAAVVGTLARLSSAPRGRKRC